jgi:hypothetical protein
MTARKTTGARRSARNASRRARNAFEEGLRDLERRLPSNLRSTVRDLRENLKAFQHQMERGRVEREARWHRMQIQLRRDMVRLLQRLEKAVAPRGSASAPPRGKTRRRKK